MRPPWNSSACLRRPQLPLAVVEGLLTVLIMMALENYAKPELKAIGFMKAGK